MSAAEAESTAGPLRRPPAGRRLVAWLAFPVVVVVFAVGVWVAGGVLTNSFRASMALVAAWYALAAAAAVLVAWRHRALAVPVIAGYVVAAAGIGAYLGWNTLHDRVVDEQVVTGVAATAAGSGSATGAATSGGTARPPARTVPVRESRGDFVSGEHDTSGVATIVRLPGGRRVLTLTDFDTSAGPDLRVRLVPGGSTDGSAGGSVDLGGLKGNRGDQQYDLPKALDPRGHTVVIWCRAFSVAFGSARLERG